MKANKYSENMQHVCSASLNKKKIQKKHPNHNIIDHEKKQLNLLFISNNFWFNSKFSSLSFMKNS